MRDKRMTSWRLSSKQIVESLTTVNILTCVCDPWRCSSWPCNRPRHPRSCPLWPAPFWTVVRRWWTGGPSQTGRWCRRYRPRRDVQSARRLKDRKGTSQAQWVCVHQRIALYKMYLLLLLNPDFFLMIFLLLHCPLREIRVALSGYGTAAARAALTIFLSVCVQYFRASQQWCGCQCLGIFNVRTDVAECDCTRGLCGHRKESLHWKSILGEKSFAAPGTKTCVSIAPGFSVGQLPTELSLPSVATVAGRSYTGLGTPLTATSFQAINVLSSFVAKHSLKYAYVFASARFCYCDWWLIRAFESVNWKGSVHLLVANSVSCNYIIISIYGW